MKKADQGIRRGIDEEPLVLETARMLDARKIGDAGEKKELSPIEALEEGLMVLVEQYEHMGAQLAQIAGALPHAKVDQGKVGERELSAAVLVSSRAVYMALTSDANLFDAACHAGMRQGTLAYDAFQVAFKWARDERQKDMGR